MKRQRDFIDFTFFKEIIDRAAGWVFHLQIANFGEPLLHPELGKIIDYAAAKGFFVELFTNGVLLNEKKSKEIVRAGVGKINISIDAFDPAIYKELRGTEIEPVLANVSALKRARENSGKKTPFIVIAGSDLRANPGEPEVIRQQFKSMGADAYYITPSMNWAGGAKDSTSLKPVGKEYAGCLFPWYLMNVSMDGRVTPCCIDAELGNAIGNVKNEDLREIWNNQKSRRLRKTLLNREIMELPKISNCHKCSRLFYSQNAYTLNRGRIEIAQLLHFLV